MANNINEPDSSGTPGAAERFPPFPPFPPLPPGPRGPAGPPGPRGPAGPAGTMNNTAQSFAYAQLAHLLEQLIEYYPGQTLYVFLPGISPWWISGTPYQLYKSEEGTFGGLFLLGDSDDNVAFPLSAIAALQFETGTAVYNPAITYLPKPDFPPGYDTNIITAIYDYVSTIPSDIDVLFNIGSNVRSTGPIYLNKYGMIVQADEFGNDPAFIPLTFITGIAPQTTTEESMAKETVDTPPTKIQAADI